MISKISPFKDVALLEKEIKEFANKFKATVVNQSKRISDYFEMSCFNYIVYYYERNEYIISIGNLQDGKYRYKCSTSGNQSNFSHFKATKQVGNQKYEFEIHHNLAVQSSQDKEIYTTPDISIIQKGKVKFRTDFYETRRVFSFVENKNLMSFCEAKQFPPFPELIFNFMGIVNELKHKILSNTEEQPDPIHIAPSLMISGKPNKQTQKIKDSLEKRYCINIIYDLFYTGADTFSKSKIMLLKRAGNNHN